MISVRRHVWKHGNIIAKNYHTIEVYFVPEIITAVLFEGLPESMMIRLVYRDVVLIDWMTVAQANRIMQYPVPILNWEFTDRVFLECNSEVDIPEGDFTVLQMCESRRRVY